MIAQVRGWGHLQYLPNGAEIQDANARLIAAAPELLEACKEMVIALTDEMASGITKEHAFSAGIRAITKAEKEI